MSKVYVLYDGQCRLCTRSVRWLKRLDWLQKLEYVNFHDTAKKEQIAPSIQVHELDKAMHIKLPSGLFKKGFYAFRALAPYLPLLTIFTPLLYIPGVPYIGNIVYAHIANTRQKCTNEECRI